MRVAARSRGERPSDDRIFTAPRAVIVLDGASQPEADAHDGGWLANTLGSRLRADLVRDPRAPLDTVLALAIGDVASTFDLTPGQAPSTTVAIVRWTEQTVDALVLGDTPVLVQTRDGKIAELRDDRLAAVARQERAAFRATSAIGGFGTDHPRQWQELVDAQRRRRNQPGGYWIAEAVPAAAAHSIRGSWPADDVAALLVLTDGVSIGVDRYGVPPDWSTAFALALDDPRLLIDAVHRVEKDDFDGARWSRSKRHDDKAVALVQFS